MNCCICNLPEPNYKPGSQVDYICWRCVSLGDVSDWRTFAEKVTDANVGRGLTFRGSDESKVHTYIRNFSPQAWRRAYVKSLFFEDETWIKCIESQDRGRVINSIVNCKGKNRTEKNLELQANLRDQIYNNLEYRIGYYEALQDGKPTTAFNKYLHPDVRRFIQKYNRYQNNTETMFEGMADDTCEFYEEVSKAVPLEEQISEDGIKYYIVFDPAVDGKPKTYIAEEEIQSGNRKIFDRGVSGKIIQHEQGTDWDITQQKEPSIRETIPEEAIILR